MNFVAQVEEHLRDLGAEARKKHPGKLNVIRSSNYRQSSHFQTKRDRSQGVKEASERAILQLRTLQNAYVTAVRKASQTGGEHPTTALFQSQDLLRPFLLAANYPNASPKLLDISLKGMSLLIKGKAICPGDGIHMVRVWTIQANVCATSLTTEKQKQPQTSSNSSWFGGMLSSTSDVSSSSGQGTPQKKESSEKLALELLRCLILLLQEESTCITDEQWTASLALCCILGHVQVMVVQQAAKTSLHQVLNLLFHTSNPNHAVETWRDLLILASQEPTPLRGAFSQCKSSAPSPTLCLELMCRILQGNPKWFLDNLYEIEIESLQVGKALLDDTASVSFELVWRSYAFTSAILTASDDDEKEAMENEEFGVANPEDQVLESADTEDEEDLKEAEDCREQLIAALMQGIVRATEACRNNHDFEDGFVFTGEAVSVKGNKSKPFVTLIPDSLLWRAGLALETLHTVLDKCPHSVTAVAETVNEAVSDFATIAASCRDHMLQLVECSQKSNRNGYEKPMIPSLFRKAEEIQFAALASIRVSENPKNLPSTSCNVGEVLWTAFNTILELSRFVDDDVSFAPSLAVMQHYLKRFPGSREITQITLVGYDRLAHIIDRGSSLQRQALLSSLCKLSLPAWGKHDSSTQLQDHHVEALICLLRIVHRYRDNILTEWYVVLWTFEELGSLSLSSPKLSDEGYKAATLVSSVYARIAPLSTTLSIESVSAMMEALNEISKASVDRRGASIVDSSGEIKNFGKDEGSISGKLMSFAGNAIMGGDKSGKNSKDIDSSLGAVKIQRLKIPYAAEYKQDFHRRLSSSRAFRSDLLADLPLSLMIMTDISLSNTFRFKICGGAISSALCALAGSSPDARAYAMDMLSLLVTSQLSDQPIPAAFIGPAEVVTEKPSRSQLLEVAATIGSLESREHVSQVDLLRPLCDTIKTTTEAGVAEAGMSSLHSLLEGSGHNLSGKVWTVVIEAVTSLAGDASYEIDRTGSDWSSCCALAFRCLKLIVDDFLDELPPPTEDSSVAPRKALMECCSSFGSSRHELNTSLTAIGLLWTIADQDSDSSSIERALDKLVFLSANSRTEVRNCAVNTLFSCIVGRGPSFSTEQWERCICDTVFGVYDQVLSRGGLPDETISENDPKKAKYKTSVHHSRNSADKQWATTEVLVLHGLNRVIRNNFVVLLETTGNVKVVVGKSSTQCGKPWLVQAWSRALEVALNAAKQGGGRDTLDLRISGLDLMVLCLQLSCRAGIQAAITPARVGTNMEVVNGALRSIGESKYTRQQETPVKKSSESVNMYREELFVMAFDALSKYQVHLNESIVEHEEVKSTRFNIEPVQVQVLQRLVVGLRKLFDCVKDDELRPSLQNDYRRPLCIDRFMPLSRETIETDDYEARFVALVVTIAKNSFGDQPQFLSQAQRGAIDLLREMVTHGSNYSFKGLAFLAGPALFWTADREHVSSDGADGSDGTGIDILAKETATVLSDEINNKLLSNETRVEVLCMLLSVFEDESDKESWKSDSKSRKEPSRKRSYKLFLPVMELGLSSAEKLASTDVTNIPGLLDLLWDRVDVVLTQMLSPIRIASHAPYISQASQLAELVKSVVAHAPLTRRNNIAALLSSGALISIDIAKDHFHATDTSRSDGKVRTKKRCDEALKMCKECMSGLCKLQPESSTLQSIAKQAFNEALASLTARQDSPSQKEVTVEIAIIVCQAIKQTDQMEGLVISLFPQLCLLITENNPLLRTEVAAILETVNIAKAMDDSTSRMEEAERRAEAAEKQNMLLTAALEELTEENSRLQRDIAVFSASSALY